MVSTKRPSRSTPGAPVAVGLASVLLAVAGCGGSSNPGVAHLSAANGAAGTSTEGGSSSRESGGPSQQQLVAFAKCMRANGVPNFPEPVEGQITLRAGPGSKSGLDPGSAAFRVAGNKCRKLLPNGGKPSPQRRKQLEERALRFSACMRSHGEPNFPEPEFQDGGASLLVKKGSGLDPRTPRFQAAQKACQPYFGAPGAKGGALRAPPPTSGGGPEGSVAVAP